jgi:YHS domain-containing protein
MRFLIFEVIGPLLLLLLARSLFRSLLEGFSAKRNTGTRAPAPPAVPAGGELKRDPVCGIYVSPASAVTRSVKGEPVYFCSKECRDKYRVA